MLLEKLKARFDWLEREDLRVGQLYLNPAQVAELEKPEQIQEFDRCAMRLLRETGIRGVLWGATVYVSELVPPGRVCIIQDGLDARLVNGEACVTL